MKRLLALAAAGIVLALAAPAAPAAIIIFTGSDDGAPVGGPFPNSSAAQASFQAAAAALGPTTTITFEGLPVGYNANFVAAPGVSVSLTGPNYGLGFSGISNNTFGNLYGFNITPGGANWLGFPDGSATFAFDDPVSAFGFWLTGTQTVFNNGVLVTFDDGTAQSLNAPVNVNGGASFFGFTDAGKLITSVTITSINIDAWGIDDVTFATPAQVEVTPEPASLALFGGMMLVGGAYVRRRRKTASA